jgi:cold shock CspA family protein
MSGAIFHYGVMRKRAPAARAGTTTGPRDLRGTPVVGRIAKLFVGQGHGYIRLTNEREVFFHRADVKDDTSFNELRLGDAVTFELFEDAVSGARALRVARRTRAR